jgi:anti-sigma B factor antagonist
VATPGCAAICSPLGIGKGCFVMPWSPRHNQLRFALEHGHERTTVLLAGELDCASAAVAHLALERAGQDAIEIVLDLSRVAFLDAAGLRFLISAQRRARAAHRRLIVRRPSRTVRRMIDLAGASPLLSIEDPEYGHFNFDGQVDEALARILDTALDSVPRTTQADAASAQLADRSSGALRLVAQRGLTGPVLDYFELVSADESLCGPGLRTSQPVWIPDLARSLILADTPALDVLLDAGVRALASLPVQAPDGQLLAVLSVYHRLVTHWTSAQMAGLEQLGRTVAEQCRSAWAPHPH